MRSSFTLPENTTPLTWKQRIKTSFIFFLVIMVPGMILDLLDLGWLFGSDASGESNAWIMDEYSVVIVGTFLILPVFNFFEELFFRYIPYKLTGGRFFWVVGVLTSLAFAWIHSLEGIREFSGLALPQFILGLFLWYYVKAGLKEVFLLHYLYNLYVIGFVQIFILLDFIA